jgi:hypothetical protein
MKIYDFGTWKPAFGGTQLRINGKYVENRVVSPSRTRDENISNIEFIEALSPDDNMPISQQDNLALFKRESRAEFDFMYPSKWPSSDNPAEARGWMRTTVTQSYREKHGNELRAYDDRVVVHYPKRFEKQIRGRRGVHQGAMTTEFTTQEKWGTCQHFVLVPGDEIAICDIGTSSVNYGVEASKLPFGFEVIHREEQNTSGCYNPTVAVMRPGFKVYKESEFLDL